MKHKFPQEFNMIYNWLSTCAPLPKTQDQPWSTSFHESWIKYTIGCAPPYVNHLACSKFLPMETVDKRHACYKSLKVS